MPNELKQTLQLIADDTSLSDEEARKYIDALFEGYTKRKRKGILYTKEDFIPQIIITSYFSYIERLNTDELYSNFKRKYIYNENQLEAVHELKERQGLSKVYDYLQELNEFSSISVYDIFLIHQKLYSLVDYPEFGGSLRTIDVYLPGAGINLTTYDNIAFELSQLYLDSRNLAERGIALSKKIDLYDLINYINDCIKLKCKIVKIHPFMDGNGRTARALLNKYFKIVGIPPVYIKKKERLEYQEAMNKAICDEEYNPDFDSINKFYYYKICDSIIDLDIHRDKEKVKTKQIC